MRILLAGVWARRGLNAACLLVIVVAVAAAVMGPMYARASVEHLVDTRIAQRPPDTTGLAYSVPASTEADAPQGSADRYRAPDPMALVAAARKAMAGPGVDRFWKPAVPWVLDTSGRLAHAGDVFETHLYWRQGMCSAAHVEGRCPRRPGEVLVQATMAKALHVGAGGRVRLAFDDDYLVTTTEHGSTTTVQQERHRTATYRVVGTYTITDPASPRWFEPSRFAGLEHLVPPPPSLGRPNPTPVAPALLTVPGTMDSQRFRGGVDRPIDVGAVNADTVDDARDASEAFKSRVLTDDAVADVQDLDLVGLFGDVHGERTLLSRVVVAALAPLVVLAQLLLFALVSAAIALRRPHIALAKLRGHSRAQVLGFAVGEPFLVVAVAAPLGAAVGVLGVHLVAARWLRPGIPLVPDTLTWAAGALVVGAALLASTAAALSVVREPLSAALRTSLRARAAGRVGLVLRSAVVAVAVATVAQLLTSGHQANQLLALLGPLFLALAVAVGGAALLRLLSRGWLRRTTERGGPSAYLASRRLARRPDLANLMVPLLLAVSVISFAASASAVSDDWRVSRADAEVGSAATYLADVGPGRLLRVTRELDPSGRHLAAAMVDKSGDDTARRVFVDTGRLATVAAWDPAWSDVPVAELQRRLRAPLGRRLSFSGSVVSVRVSDVALRAPKGEVAELRLRYVDPAGEEQDTRLGRLRNGPGGTLTAPTPGCSRGCLLTELYVSGDSASVSDVDGRLTLAAVSVDGRPADWGLDDTGAWRPARPFPVSLVDPPVVLEQTPHGLRLRLYLGQLPPGADRNPTMVSGYARITPRSTPDTAPVLVASRTRTTRAARAGGGTALTYGPRIVEGTALSGAAAPMRVVARVHALPVVGDSGVLGDLETQLVEFPPPQEAQVVTELWTAPGTPPALLDRVRAAHVGLTLLGTRAATLRELRGDAFSLGLRLFLVTGLATLLLAVFGVLGSAVLQGRWRSYEVASLRVVGVSQRSLLVGSVLEYVVMLGLAVLLGAVSTYLSLRLVLPSMSLGTAAEHEPAPLYDVHWLLLGGVTAALFAVALVIAVVVSRRTTRQGRPATLRWAEAG